VKWSRALKTKFTRVGLRTNRICSDVFNKRFRVCRLLNVILKALRGYANIFLFFTNR